MKRFDQINVIPFIDIMLVLLAIVLTTASFISQGLIPVELPKIEKSSIPSDSKSLNISIKNNGNIFVDKNLQTLVQFKLFLQQREKTSKVQLRIDKKADFNSFVQVAQLLKVHQYEQVAIVVNEGLQ